jgi:hypothetical protein
MSTMPPGYDDWKTRSPYDEDPRCEYCGASEARGSLARQGWQPDECTGECRIRWRDPDAEYEASRDDR